MRSILNCALPSVADLDEMERDGFLRRAGGGEITQSALRAFCEAQARVERLAVLLRTALLNGAAVEAGDLDAGLFRDKERKVNWRQAFVDLGGDAAALNAATPQTESSPRLRVYPTEEKPKGRQIAPTLNGQPVEVGQPVAGDDAAAA